MCVPSDDPAESPPPCTHTSVFVNDGHGKPLRDNDIRGFLDGGFRWGWNQAEQTKVRVGRARSSIRPPEYGEDELFRALQRWESVDLPPGSRVADARLRLHTQGSLEGGDVAVYLYAARRDWNPGSGGVRQDNVSVPASGEVWWGEARHEREPWGLPGAGFAADRHPDADTGLQPVAVARREAGDGRIEFGGDRLTRHVREKVRSGEPLLFLLKLSDWEEDEPGSVLALCSAEHGTDRAPGRRPRLRLEWTPGRRTDCVREEVFLEYGRSRTLPPMPVGPDRPVWPVFEPASGSGAATLEVRDVTPDGEPGSGGWRRVASPVRSTTGRIQLRIVAARRPLTLGDVYSAHLSDTWVVSAPPEDQELEWTFVSPSGTTHEVSADYRGDFTWRVRFVPDEIGRWRVRWRHGFAGPVRTGPECAFDVLGGDLENVREEVRDLARRAAELPRSGERKEREVVRFLRLERAGMRELTADAYRSAPGRHLRADLGRAREALWGRAVPDEFPMESHELRRETGGRELDEPIPRYDEHFRGDGRRRARRGVPRLVRRLAGWARELGARIGLASAADGGSGRSSSPAPGGRGE